MHYFRVCIGLNEEQYRIALGEYQRFLEFANAIVIRMRESFTKIMETYRQHIERLWNAIQQGYDVRPLQHEFQQRIQQNIDQYWTPVFRRADELIQEIEINLNPLPSRRPMPPLATHDQQQYYSSSH